MNDNEKEASEQETITIEVVYASPSAQKLVELDVARGSTALEAVGLSGLAVHFPEIDLNNLDLGIFSKPLDGRGRPLPQDYVLEPLDRVEIYRPLTIDPMQARLARAQEKKAEKEAEKEAAREAAREAGKDSGKAKRASQKSQRETITGADRTA